MQRCKLFVIPVMLLAIKALIVPNVRKVGKDFIVVAADMVKAVVNNFQEDAVEKETMWENMEEVEVVVVKKGVKENIILTTTTHVPVIFVISQAILLQIAHMEESLHKC